MGDPGHRLPSMAQPLAGSLSLPASKDYINFWSRQLPSPGGRGWDGMGSGYFWSRYFPSPLLCTQAGECGGETTARQHPLSLPALSHRSGTGNGKQLLL